MTDTTPVIIVCQWCPWTSPQERVLLHPRYAYLYALRALNRYQQHLSEHTAILESETRELALGGVHNG